MKIIQRTPDLRMLVKDYDGKIELVVQERRKWHFFFYHVNVDRLTVELRTFWGYVPGDKRFGDCLKLSYAGGGDLEVWPQDIFNLQSRIDQMFSDYFDAKRADLKCRLLLQKQLDKL